MGMIMNEGQMVSLILLSVAMASEKATASIEEISVIAGRINNDVPLSDKVESALIFLATKKLIAKEKGRYKLTKEGMIQFNFATIKAKALPDIWEHLERQIMT